MVKFVCYFLRIVADEEARMAQDSSSEAESEPTEDEDEDEDEDEVEDSCSSSQSGGNRSHSRSRRHAQAGRRKETDLMKDARELFCWKGRQKELAVAL